MIKLHITYQLNEDSEPVTFISKNQYGRDDFTPQFFDDNHIEELHREAPFIADWIWRSINAQTNHQKVFNSSVKCVAEFSNGVLKEIPTYVIFSLPN